MEGCEDEGEEKRWHHQTRTLPDGKEAKEGYEQGKEVKEGYEQCKGAREGYAQG